MPSSQSEGQPAPDAAERQAARAVSAFLEARNADPDLSPDEFAPSESQAAKQYWKAVEGLGVLVGDLGPKDRDAADTEAKPGAGPEQASGEQRSQETAPMATHPRTR
jgi:hypothetical protein